MLRAALHVPTRRPRAGVFPLARRAKDEVSRETKGACVLCRRPANGRSVQIGANAVTRLLFVSRRGMQVRQLRFYRKSVAC